MFLDKVIQGKYIDLYSVTEADAEFILKLRSDDRKNRFLHKIKPDINEQKIWIKKQIDRENDYYFIYKNKEGLSKGLASVYDIDEVGRKAEFGRWISEGNVYENLESVILLFDFAFYNFNIDYIYLRMVQGNDIVSNFWKTFGAEHIGPVYEMDLDLDKWIVRKENYFNSIRGKHTKLLRY